MKYESHDIGKILGLLTLGGGIKEFLESSLGMLFGASQILDFGFIFAIIVGIALYYHKNWARILTLCLSYLGAVVCVIIGIVYPFHPSGMVSEVSFRGKIIENPALWKVYIILVFAFLCFGLLIYFLRTEKAKKEFGVV